MTDRVTIEQEKTRIIDEFALFGSWTERYVYIVELGRALPDLPRSMRIDANLVPGCQSQVWFHARRENGHIHFQADSDALIVRGLIALLLRVYSGRLASEIIATPPDFFEKIELGSHLSGSRANGLHAMVARIQAFARAFEEHEKEISIDPTSLA